MNACTLPSKPTSVKPLVRLDPESGLVRRSKRLPLADALALCQRLANLRYLHTPQVVDIRESAARGRTAVVQWEPSKSESKEALKEWFRASRMSRAAEQLPVMSFYPLDGNPGRFVAINDDGHGEVSHIIDLIHEECDCSDFAFRCRLIGEKCHHLHAFDLRMEQATLPASALATSEQRTARREWAATNAQRDF